MSHQQWARIQSAEDAASWVGAPRREERGPHISLGELEGLIRDVREAGAPIGARLTLRVTNALAEKPATLAVIAWELDN